MKWLVTGLNGTLAPVLARAAAATGVQVIGWDRGRLDPEDADAGDAWLEAERPDAIAHLAMGSPAWTGRLAAHAARHGVPFVFTSTVMVFEHVPDGPHHAADERTGRSDYGRYKIACEDAVRAAHAGACIVRIGWQIDAAQPGNNMLLTLDGWQANEGRVACSRAWRPACSFMDDTAAVLVGLLRAPRPGTHHLDSNAGEAHSFDRVAEALKAAFARDAWRIEVHEDYRHDQRLAGSLAVPPLSARLPALRQAP
jgi:dTDP-4-dehydrorhamnose reductase